MAAIFPDEGLDLILGIFPKGGTNDTTLGLHLFTSQTASTVITAGQTLANVTETTYTNYAAQALTGATWGAVAAGTGGRKTTYPQVTFPTCGATGATINGFFISDATTATKVITQSNFSDTTAVTLTENDVIRVTPTIQYNNS